MKNENDVEICRRNLRRASEEFLHADEKRAAYIRELGRAVLSQERPATVNEAASLFELFGTGGETVPDPGSPFAGRLGFLSSVASVADGAFAASLIRRTCGAGGDISEYTEKTERTAEKPGGISYFRSPAADQAFDVFAARIPDPSVSYGRDFTAVCENVYYGRTRYCILPVSNSSDGRLSGFYALAEKYELIAVDECRVAYGDGETDLALFSAGYLPYKTRDKLRVRLKIPHQPDTLFTVLTAASYCGARCVENDSLPTGFGTSDMLAFSGGRESVCDLLFYLCCCQIKFDITGVLCHEDV